MNDDRHIKIWTPEQCPEELNVLRTHDDARRDPRRRPRCVDWVVYVPATLVDTYWEGALAYGKYSEDIDRPAHMFESGALLLVLTHA